MEASTLSLIFGGLGLGTASIFHTIGVFNAQRSHRHAIESRQAQFVSALHDKVVAPEYWSEFNEVLTTWQWDDYDDFMRKYGPSHPEKWRMLWRVCGVWEHAGLLVRDGIVESHLVWHWLGNYPINLWNKLRPVVVEYRAREEPEPKGMVMEWFEDLVDRLELDRARDRSELPQRLRERAERRKLLSR